MSSSRKWLFALLALLAAGAATLGLWHWLTSPPIPRPLFHEWVYIEGKGFCWWQNSTGPDHYGTFAYCDTTLNMTVIIAAGVTSWSEVVTSEHAKLFVGTPFETVIEPVRNQITIISREGLRNSFVAPEGYARRLLVALRERSLDVPICRVAVEVYEGDTVGLRNAFRAQGQCAE